MAASCASARSQDLEQAEQGASEATLHLTRDQSQIDELRRELEQLEPGLAAARERERASAAALAHAEESMQDWQERWEDFNRDSRAASEKTQVERARIEQLEHQLARLRTQRERLAAELATLRHGEIDARSRCAAGRADRTRRRGRERRSAAASGDRRVCSVARARTRTGAAPTTQPQAVAGRAGPADVAAGVAAGRARSGTGQGDRVAGVQCADGSSATGAAARRRAGLGARGRNRAGFLPRSGVGRCDRLHRRPARFAAGGLGVVLRRRRRQHAERRCQPSAGARAGTGRDFGAC